MSSHPSPRPLEQAPSYGHGSSTAIVDRGVGARRSVLVISTVEHPGAAVRRFLRERDKIEILAPIVAQGILDWLADDQSAYARVAKVGGRAAGEIAGNDAEASTGEGDVELAILDALATFPADEIVVALGRDDDEALTLRGHFDEERAQRAFAGVPLRVVVVPNEPALDSRYPAAPGPRQKRTRKKP